MFNDHIRRCRRCGKLFHTPAKFGKICLSCWKKKKPTWIQNLEKEEKLELLRKRLEEENE